MPPGADEKPVGCPIASTTCWRVMFGCIAVGPTLDVVKPGAVAQAVSPINGATAKTANLMQSLPGHLFLGVGLNALAIRGNDA